MCDDVIKGGFTHTRVGPVVLRVVDVSPFRASSGLVGRRSDVLHRLVDREGLMLFI